MTGSRLGTSGGAPRLWATLSATLLLAGALAAGTLYARHLERVYIHALAPELFAQKRQGRAAQAEALRQPDLLLMYGSSEIDSYLGPYHASELFKTYPTGFTVFPIGGQGLTPLVILQQLAAMGAELRDRKISILVSPTFVRASGQVRNNYYAGNFSRLHALELAFSAELSPALKQVAAQRMLKYRQTLQNAPLLEFTLRRLAGGTQLDRALYDAVLPLGRLETLVLRLQDHWEMLLYIRSRPDLTPDVPRRPDRLDWSSLTALAEQEARRRADNNSFGFVNEYWERYGSKLTRQRGRHSDRAFRRGLREEMDWTDLELLLRGLQELGARPLLLSVPMKGRYYDYWGVSPGAREAYYEKLQEVAEPYRVPVLDFREYDQDQYFVVDDRSHPSQTGWVSYARALDAFFRDDLAGFCAQERRSAAGGARATCTDHPNRLRR